MRRTCLMLLVLSATLQTALAADNPFSRPQSEPKSPVTDPTASGGKKPLAMQEIKNPVAPVPDAKAANKYLQALNDAGNTPASMADLIIASRTGLLSPLGPSQPLSTPATEAQKGDRTTNTEASGDQPPPVVEEIQNPENAYGLEGLGELMGDGAGQSLLFAPSIYGDNRLAEVVNDRLAIPPLLVPTTSTSSIGNKTLPEDVGRDTLLIAKPLPEGMDRNEDWTLTNYFWQAPNTFSHPLYFDDPMLERHGHERFPCLTPVISGARFFATIPMLPYVTTVRHPCDYVYTLGHFRPGSRAPALLKRPPYESRAAVVQALAAAGFFVIWP